MTGKKFSHIKEYGGNSHFIVKIIFLLYVLTQWVLGLYNVLDVRAPLLAIGNLSQKKEWTIIYWSRTPVLLSLCSSVKWFLCFSLDSKFVILVGIFIDLLLYRTATSPREKSECRCFFFYSVCHGG